MRAVAEAWPGRTHVNSRPVASRTARRAGSRQPRTQPEGVDAVVAPASGGEVRLLSTAVVSLADHVRAPSPPTMACPANRADPDHVVAVRTAVWTGHPSTSHHPSRATLPPSSPSTEPCCAPGSHLAMQVALHAIRPTRARTGLGGPSPCSQRSRPPFGRLAIVWTVESEPARSGDWW